MSWDSICFTVSKPTPIMIRTAVPPNGKGADELVPPAVSGRAGRDAAFATELAYGTLRIRGLLDAIIAKAADRPVERIDPLLLDLLRLPTSAHTR
jgi:hypothetical protein